MSSIGFTDLRQNLARRLDEVETSRAPLHVTRGGRSAVVIVSAEEFDSMQETIHLLRSPVNAGRLMRAVAALDAGVFEEHDPTGGA